MVSINWSVALTITSFLVPCFFFFNFVQKHESHQWPEFLLELWNNNSSWWTEAQDSLGWKWTLTAPFSLPFSKKGQLKSGCSAPHPFDFLTGQGEISQLLWVLCSPGRCFSPSHLCGVLLICTLQCLSCKGESSAGHRCGLRGEKPDQPFCSLILSNLHLPEHQVKVPRALQAQLSPWLLRSCACICCDKWSSDFWQQKLSALQYCSFSGLRAIRLSMPWAADLTGLSADVPTESLPILVTS